MANVTDHKFAFLKWKLALFFKINDVLNEQLTHKKNRHKVGSEGET